ncbi:MAG: hypothetical protein AAFX85_15560 [Pseudomonadota bacterium]
MKHRNTLISALALTLAATVAEADTHSATDAQAEAASQAAWAALRERIPDLQATPHTNAATSVPNIEDLPEIQRTCIKHSQLGTYLKRRICYTPAELEKLLRRQSARYGTRTYTRRRDNERP